MQVKGHWYSALQRLSVNLVHSAQKITNKTEKLLVYF